MNEDNIFSHRQPGYVWLFSLGIPLVIVVLLCISGKYQAFWYIAAFFCLVIALCDVFLKYRDIRELRKRNEKVHWWSNKFLKESGFFSCGLAAFCLIGEIVFRINAIIVVTFGFPMLFGVLFLTIIDIRGLIILLRGRGDQDAR